MKSLRRLFVGYKHISSKQTWPHQWNRISLFSYFMPWSRKCFRWPFPFGMVGSLCGLALSRHKWKNETENPPNMVKVKIQSAQELHYLCWCRWCCRFIVSIIWLIWHNTMCSKLAQFHAFQWLFCVLKLFATSKWKHLFRSQSVVES